MAVKQFRDFKDKFDLKNVEIPLASVQSSKFNIIAQYRLNEIMGSNVFWQSYQLALAFLQSSEHFIHDDLYATFKINSGQKIPQDARDAFVERSSEILMEQNNEFDKYIAMMKHFHEIAKIFENEKLTFKTIRELRKRPEIVSILENLSETFEDQLKPYNEAPQDNLMKAEE